MECVYHHFNASSRSWYTWVEKHCRNTMDIELLNLNFQPLLKNIDSTPTSTSTYQSCTEMWSPHIRFASLTPHNEWQGKPMNDHTWVEQNIQINQSHMCNCAYARWFSCNEQKLGRKSRRGSFRRTTWWNCSPSWLWGIFSPSN